MKNTDLAKKTNTDSNTLSIKLLKTIGSTFDGQSTRGTISNLKDLSNRIKIANQKLDAKPAKKYQTQQWIKSHGINLDTLTLQVREFKNQEKKATVLHVKEQEDKQKHNPLNPDFKDLPFDQFSFQCEERFAYGAIMRSMNTSSAHTDRPLRNLVAQNFKKIWGINYSQPQIAHSKKAQESRKDLSIDLYAQLLQNASIHDLHEQIFKHFEDHQDPTKKWIELVCYHIAMAANFDPRTYQNDNVDGNIDPRNYFSTVSLEMLQKLWKEEFANNRYHMIGGYNFQNNVPAFAQSQHSRYDQLPLQEDDGWRDVYFALRKGDRTNFLNQCKNKQKQLGQIYENLLEGIQNFKKNQLEFTSITVNADMTFFQRILKLVSLGLYQQIFDRCSPLCQTLDEPWLILMSLGYSGPKRQKQRENQALKAAKHYYKSVKSKLQKEPSDSLIMYFAIGLLSLGKPQLLLKIYRQFFEYIKSSQIYIDFIHIFISLAANPRVLYLQLKPTQAKELIQNLYEQITQYILELNSKNKYHFKLYFRLLVQSIIQLNNEIFEFPLEQLIKNVCSILLKNINNVEALVSQPLILNGNDHRVTHTFQTTIIKSFIPRNQNQFVKLAQLCSQMELQQLREEVLVQMLVQNYCQHQNRENHSNFFGNPGDISQKQKDCIVKDTIQWLQKYMPKSRIAVLNFIKTLKELRQAVTHRKVDTLTKQEQQFTYFRRNFETVLDYLSRLDNDKKDRHTDIFLQYAQKLSQLYRMVYLSKNDYQRYKEEQMGLVKDMQVYRREYPQISKDVFGRAMDRIQR